MFEFIRTFPSRYRRKWFRIGRMGSWSRWKRKSGFYANRWICWLPNDTLPSNVNMCSERRRCCLGSSLWSIRGSFPSTYVIVHLQYFSLEIKIATHICFFKCRNKICQMVGSVSVDPIPSSKLQELSVSSNLTQELYTKQEISQTCHECKWIPLLL